MYCKMLLKVDLEDIYLKGGFLVSSGRKNILKSWAEAQAKETERYDL